MIQSMKKVTDLLSKNYIILIVVAAVLLFIVLLSVLFALSKCFKKKNNDSADKNQKPVPVDNIFYPDDLIKTIISFVISSYEKGGLKIGKRKDKNDIFISFVDKALAEFLQDFFVICKSKDEGMLSDAAYRSFIGNFWTSYEKSERPSAANSGREIEETRTLTKDEAI